MHTYSLKKARIIFFTLKISWSKYLGSWRIKVRFLRDLKNNGEVKAEAKRSAHGGHWSYVYGERALG